VGRWELLDPIGRGGEGQVWKARLVDGQDLAAIKVFHTNDPPTFQGLRRELFALDQLEHPGVVGILDHGIADGVPWYAMQYVAGPTLDQLIQAGELRRSLRCVAQVARTLVHVHGEGVVHRDIKPKNIVVRGDHDAVLVDFGFAIRAQARGRREVLQVPTVGSGTVAYMAPEQLRGEDLDARADLYALGCVLHEVLTGAPPFQGSTQEVIGGHLLSVPAPIRAEGVDPELASLVADLLAKDPRDRLGYARDVVHIIEARLGRPSGDVQGRSYLYRPGFAGRGASLRDLKKGLLATEEIGVGKAFLLAGESGVGKTRLASELGRFAVQGGRTLVNVECLPSGSRGGDASKSAALEPLRAMLRAMGDVCLSGGDDVVAKVLGPRAGLLARHEPSLAAFVEADDGPMGALSGPAARERLVEAVVESMAALHAVSPYVLLVDDLQWIDEISLAVLETFITRRLLACGVFIVGTYRVEEAPPEILALGELPAVETIALEAIEEEAVGAIVGDMLALRDPPQDLVRFVAERSEGNPFFVAEYLLAAAEESLIRRQVGGAWRMGADADVALQTQGLALPSSLRALVERRLDGLTENARSLVTAAAVLGREFDADLAGAMVQADPQEAVLELMRRRIVQATGRGGLRFGHDRLREVAYDSAGTETTRELHLRAAEAIGGADPTAGPASAVDQVLARHFEGAGERARACRHHARAGLFAWGRGAGQAATSHLARALALDRETGGRTDDVERGHWQRVLGSSAFSTGDLQTCIVTTTSSLDTLGVAIPSTAPGWIWFAIQQLVGQLRAGHRDDLAAKEASEAAVQLAISYYYDARLVESVAAILLGVNLSRRSRTPRPLADSLCRAAYVAGVGQLGWLADRLFARAHEVAAEVPDSTAPGIVAYMDSMYRLGIGAFDQALGLAERGAAELMRIGNAQEAEVAMTLAGHAEYYRGDVVPAWDRYQAILREAMDRGNGQHEAWGQFLGARSLLAMGRHEAALDDLQAAHPRLVVLPDQVSLTICEGLLARALLAVGHEDEAASRARALLDTFTAGKRPMVAQCVDAYEGAAHVLAVLADRGRASPAEAERALRELGRFAMAFPLGRPASWRLKAASALRRGRLSRARRHARRAIDAADALGVVVESIRSRRYAASIHEGDVSEGYAAMAESLQARMVRPFAEAP